MNNHAPYLLEPALWSFPIPIAYGPGRITELGSFCLDAGMRRPLLVTDRGSANLAFVGAALASLTASGISGEVYADISPNPTDVEIDAGRSYFCQHGHDGVIAIGGGSGMDAGKAISLVARNDHDLWEFDYDRAEAPALLRADFVPLVTIPTTAGTGAETESTAMVTSVARGVKGCVWHAAHKPSVTLLDPDLTLQLPANLTAWTGVDALVHAIEAFTVPAFHPACDALALQAIRLIYPWLPHAVAEGDNREARAAMLVGSCLAGVAFLKGLGLVHAMSHMIGATHDTHHGLTNAVLLPPVLRYNRDQMEAKATQMAVAMGLENPGFDSFYASIVVLLEALEIPDNLGALGIGEDDIGVLAKKAHTDAACATNAKAVSVAQIETLLREALTQVR
jgi:alcohol dehydrogenase class IV